MKLLMFLADLWRNTSLQNEFTFDPKKVMDRAGLTEKEQAAVLSHDRKKVAQAVTETIIGNKTQVLLPWSTPGNPKIISVEPSQGGRGTSIKLHVNGVLEHNDTSPMSLFAQDENKKLRCLLIQGETVIRDESVDNTKVQDPNWSLDAWFKLPSDAPTGLYDVRVEDEETKIQASGQGLFTLT